MRNMIYFFVLITVLASCEKSDMDECYRMSPDVTEKSCVSEKCQLKYASIEFYSPSHSCVLGWDSGIWVKYSARRRVMPVCYPKYKGLVDADPVPVLYCKWFTKTAFFVLYLSRKFLKQESAVGLV